MLTLELICLVCLQCLVLYTCSLYGEGSYTYCKDGWLPFNGSCYWFGENAVHFTEAEHYCQQKDSHLIHVNTEIENLFIKDHLRALKSNNFWMGMTDEEIEGVWKWIDSDSYVDWFDWGPREPTVGNNQDCGVFWEVLDFQWGDLGCTQTAVAVCKVRSDAVRELEIVGK